MELIEQSYDILGPTPLTPEESSLWMERAARECYQSMDKIGPGSDKTIFNGLFKSGHGSVFEHSNIVMVTKEGAPAVLPEITKLVNSSDYIHRIRKDGRQYLYGNWRAWYEVLQLYSGMPFDEDITWASLYELIPDLFPDLELAPDNKDIPCNARRVSVRITTDRAILAEITRHRVLSFSVESQRFLRYMFIKFIYPYWYKTSPERPKRIFRESCVQAESNYGELLKAMSQQGARAVLTNQVACNMTVSGYIPQWEGLFKLRTPKHVYPQFRNLAVPMEQEFKEQDWYK